MEYTRYEIARIIGARALQLAMGAPILIKRDKDTFDTVKIATEEFEKMVLPITIRRPKPMRLEIE